MSFADSGVRTVLDGLLPQLVTFTTAVVEGGLVGYSSGWKPADGSPTIAARGVAAKSYAASEEGVFFAIARVNGFTGGTPGAALYLSDTAGTYGDSAGTYTQVVGYMLSETEAVIAPNGIAVAIGTLEDGTVTLAKLEDITAAYIIVGNASGVPTAVAMSGDAAISNAGVVSIAAGVLVNADVNAAAAIAWSKMAALADGHLLVGSGTGVATDVALSGDATIVNTGAITIGAGKVTAAKLSAEGKLRTIRTSVIDIDTVGATTYDEIAIAPLSGIEIVGVKIVYDKETSGTVAGGGVKVGTQAGGEEIVASTALENSKAVGYVKECTIVEGTVAADTPVFVRLTGVAATQAGAVHVEVDFYYTDPA